VSIQVLLLFLAAMACWKCWVNRIALGRRAVDALTEHRELAKLEKQVAPEWADLDLVFSDVQGRPINGKNRLRAQFRPHPTKAGLPLIRFHDLRHTATTLLLGRGVNPKVVSEMLGHSTIANTLAISSHVVPHMQQGAAREMDDILSGRAPQTPTSSTNRTSLTNQARWVIPGINPEKRRHTR
jgi:integrase